MMNVTVALRISFSWLLRSSSSLVASGWSMQWLTRRRVRSASNLVDGIVIRSTCPASGIVQARQTLEIDIAAVHDIKRSRFRHQSVQNVDIMHFAVADEDE